MKTDPRPFSARRGVPLPSTDNWMRCKSRRADKTGTRTPRKRINGQKWPLYPTPGGWQRGSIGTRKKKKRKREKFDRSPRHKFPTRCRWLNDAIKTRAAAWREPVEASDTRKGCYKTRCRKTSHREIRRCAYIWRIVPWLFLCISL